MNNRSHTGYFHFLLPLMMVLASGATGQHNAGHLLWQRSFVSQTDYSDDKGLMLAVDLQGNTYAVGTLGAEVGSDIVTTKYNGAGTELWTVRYDGTGKGIDIPTCIGVNRDGEVFVAGMSQGLQGHVVTQHDFVTIKYTADGHEAWVRRFDGGLSDDVGALVVTDDGGVVVSGTSRLDAGWHYGRGDIVTIAYGASGETQWLQRLHGNAEYGNNSVTRLLRGKDGSTILVGNLEDSLSRSGYPPWTAFELCLVKYSPEGFLQWNRTIVHTDTTGVKVRDAVLTPNGRVVLTGIRGYRTLTTIAFSSEGDSLWSDSVPAAEWWWRIPCPTRLAADVQGNIIVIGIIGQYSWFYHDGDSLIVIKYTMDGTREWIRYEGSSVRKKVSAGSVCVDASGAVYIAGGKGTQTETGSSIYPDSILVLKYAPDGTLLWRLSQAEFPQSSSVSGIAVTPSGNLSIIGWTRTADASDLLAGGISPAGQALWVSHKNGVGAANDGISGMVVDKAGNVYLAGSTWNRHALLDLLVVKYNASGDLLWSREYDGPSHFHDAAMALALDRDGGVYVAGASEGANGKRDILTMRYASDGTMRWAQRFDHPVHWDDFPECIAVDSMGNVFVAGQGASQDIFTLSYDPDGQLRWTAVFDSLGWVTAASDITIDPWGDVIVTGGGGVAAAMRTIKYNNRGVLLWTAPGGSAVATDESGAVYVTGERPLARTMKFDRYGVQQWSLPYAGDQITLTGYQDICLSQVSAPVLTRLTRDGVLLWRDTLGAYFGGINVHRVDEEGSMYVAGSAASSMFSPDRRFLVSCVDPSGYLRWTTSFLDDETFVGTVAGLDVDASGTVALAGVGNRWNQSGTTYIMKFEQITTGGLNDGGKPAGVRLLQNYPNPFNPSTTIAYSVDTHGIVSLKIYDVLGREVVTLVEGERNPGEFSVVWKGTNGSGAPVGSGIYFSRLRVGERSVTRSMFLVK